MRAPTVLVALTLAPALVAASSDPTPGSTPSGAPVADAAPTAPAVASASPLPVGLRVDADLRNEYLTGFPMLITVTVHNDTAGAIRVPDLYSRPHLVHFLLDGPRGRSERYSTPPGTDSGAEWTVPPGGSRRALLEVPSSAGFAAGAWTVAVRLALPGGNVDLPPHKATLAPAAPSGGSFVWEPTIAANTGAMTPWTHRAAQGFDLYLMQSRPKAPQDVVAQYYLAHLTAAADPILSRSRAADAQSRHIYWASGPHDVTVARLDGAALHGPPRTLSLPWPSVELLARGVSDPAGGLTVPIWIPAPSGAAGEVRVVRLDERGALTFRVVASYARRPDTVATAVDAAGNLLLAMSDTSGIVLYQVDSKAPPELPARGARVWKRDPAWTPRALTFDTLPDTTSHPGGLALLTVLTQATPGSTSRLLWSDITGTVFSDTAGASWTPPGAIISLLPSGYGPLYALTRDADGTPWYAPLGTPPVKAPASGTLWTKDQAVLIRSLTPGTVAHDDTVGPRIP